MFITTACFFSLQNTQVHKSYENKTVFIHTAHTTATHLFSCHYNRIRFHMIFSLLYFLSLRYVLSELIYVCDYNYVVMVCQLFWL